MGVAVSWGIGHRCSSDPELLWPWRRPVAAAPIRPLAWEPPRKGKKTKKKKKILGDNGEGIQETFKSIYGLNCLSAFKVQLDEVVVTLIITCVACPRVRHCSRTLQVLFTRSHLTRPVIRLVIVPISQMRKQEMSLAKCTQLIST